MKTIFIRNSRIPALVSWFFPVTAITLWPFVFIREGYDTPRLITHEAIHIKQYNELFVLGFLFLYIYDWVHGLIRYRDAYQAYLSIRFEQEARQHEHADYYLLSRPRFNWKRYKV